MVDTYALRSVGVWGGEGEGREEVVSGSGEVSGGLVVSGKCGEGREEVVSGSGCSGGFVVSGKCVGGEEKRWLVVVILMGIVDELVVG